MALLIGAYALAAAAVGGSGYYLYYRSPSEKSTAPVEMTPVVAEPPKLIVVTAEDLKTFSRRCARSSQSWRLQPCTKPHRQHPTKSPSRKR